MDIASQLADPAFKWWVVDNLNWFSEAEFAELYVAYLLNGRKSGRPGFKSNGGWGAPFDVLLKNGLRVEVKYSEVNCSDLGNPNIEKSHFLQWQHLRGHNGNKDGQVDYLVLCAFLDDWCFWVIPYESFGKRHMRHFLDSERTNKQDHYFVGNEQELQHYFRFKV